MISRPRATGRADSGTYLKLPHSLIRHPAFAELSPRATKLFIDLAAEYRGNNNGDLSAAWTLMKERGWRSRDQLFKALTELLDKGFIEKTRQGGRNMCNLYALTFRPIDECRGKLDVGATSVPSNTWKKLYEEKSVTRDEG